MSENQLKYDLSLTIGASAVEQYDLVKTPAACVVTAAATDDAVGIVQNGYAANATEAKVRVFGITKARAAGAITVGAPLVPAAAGEVDAHDGTTANPIVGVALEAAGAQGDEILIFLGIHALRAGFAA